MILLCATIADYGDVAARAARLVGPRAGETSRRRPRSSMVGTGAGADALQRALDADWSREMDGWWVGPRTTADSCRDQLRGKAIQPEDAGYDEARAVHNRSIDHRPGAIARCADVAAMITTIPPAARGGAGVPAWRWAERIRPRCQRMAGS